MGIEFYLILTAVNPKIGGGMFWRLMLGTVAMLAFGFLGESGGMNAWLGFCLGMAGWGFILFEIFFGEAAECAVNADKVNKHIKGSYDTMRFIVTVGWSIYPLGYFFGYLMHQWGDSPCNFTYNMPTSSTRLPSASPSGGPARRTPLTPLVTKLLDYVRLGDNDSLRFYEGWGGAVSVN